MHDPLTLKLKTFADLSKEDLAVVENLAVEVRSLDAGHDLIKEGDRPESVFLLVDGWAYRYKILPDGRRQILAYLVPGDLCDVNIFVLKEMDHAIGLLSDARVAAIPKQKIVAIFDEHPALARALWWATLVDEGVLREWIVNMGQRDAYRRIAHLFAELWFRLQTVGKTSDRTFDLPLTQTDLGDTVGLTSVHVNRTLQRMRAEGLIELRGKRLRIPDIEKLIDVAEFVPNYLHYDRRVNARGHAR